MKSETFVCLYEDTLRFEIKVESRVTILYGDSGTGKTTFIECVTDSWDPDKRKDVAVLDYAEIDDPLGYLALKKNLTYVFIDEESANDLDRDELLEPILDAGYFLVIATRRPLLHLTYGLRMFLNYRLLMMLPRLFSITLISIRFQSAKRMLVKIVTPDIIIGRVSLQ